MYVRTLWVATVVADIILRCFCWNSSRLGCRYLHSHMVHVGALWVVTETIDGMRVSWLWTRRRYTWAELQWLPITAIRTLESLSEFQPCLKLPSLRLYGVRWCDVGYHRSGSSVEASVPAIFPPKINMRQGGSIKGAHSVASLYAMIEVSLDQGYRFTAWDDARVTGLCGVWP